jgi:hypothetical protein
VGKGKVSVLILKIQKLLFGIFEAKDLMGRRNSNKTLIFYGKQR